MNISQIAKFLDQRLSLRLVLDLILSLVEFCNSLYYELPNKDLRVLQILINLSAQVVKATSHCSYYADMHQAAFPAN